YLVLLSALFSPGNQSPHRDGTGSTQFPFLGTAGWVRRMASWHGVGFRRVQPLPQWQKSRPRPVTASLPTSYPCSRVSPFRRLRAGRLCNRCDTNVPSVTKAQVAGLMRGDARIPDNDELMNLLTNVRPTAPRCNVVPWTSSQVREVCGNFECRYEKPEVDGSTPSLTHR